MKLFFFSTLFLCAASQASERGIGWRWRKAQEARETTPQHEGKTATTRRWTRRVHNADSRGAVSGAAQYTGRIVAGYGDDGAETAETEQYRAEAKLSVGGATSVQSTDFRSLQVCVEKMFRLKLWMSMKKTSYCIFDDIELMFFVCSDRAANYAAQGYDDGSLYSSHYAPGQGQPGSETYQSPGGQSTPSRGGRSRPSQPPPAPPSNASSNSTPTIASANNTPTRGRSMSTGRDTLPPPPPPPGEVMSPPSMNGRNIDEFCRNQKAPHRNFITLS